MLPSSITAMKEGYERMQNRIHSIKKASEKTLDVASSVFFTNLTAAAAGFANEKWGQAGAGMSAPAGMKELTVMNMPADVLAGIAVVGFSMFGAFGKYDHFALSVANGLTAGFSYRFGTEMARKGGAAPGQMASGARTNAWGRQRAVSYAP